MNRLAGLTPGDDLLKKADELGAGVALSRLAGHLAGLHVQSGIQRERAIPLLLETMPFLLIIVPVTMAAPDRAGPVLESL
jgi:hypothetical protein